MRLARREKGSALVLSVWAVSLFGIFVSQLSFYHYPAALLARREQEQIHAHRIFKAGVDLAVSTAANYEDGQVPRRDDINEAGDVLASEWGRELRIYLTDEEGKLNLNLAEELMIETLLDILQREHGLRLTHDPQEMAKALIRWRDEKRNRKIDFLTELSWIGKGFEAMDWNVLENYVTVYTETSGLLRFNINSAPQEVIAAILQSISADEFTKRELLNKWEDYREAALSSGNILLSGQALEPEVFTRTLGLSRSPQMIALLNRFLMHCRTDSTVFSARMEIRSNHKKAAAVFRSTQENPLGREILYWHEE